MTFEEFVKTHNKEFRKVCFVRFIAQYFNVPMSVALEFTNILDDINDESKTEVQQMYNVFLSQTGDHLKAVFNRYSDCENAEEEILKHLYDE